MAFAMEAAKGWHSLHGSGPAKPVNGEHVEGPVLDPNRLSFIGYYPLPVRYGLTVGELAELFRTENHLEVQLEVVRMKGWERKFWFDETDLSWVNPSPNIRNLQSDSVHYHRALGGNQCFSGERYGHAFSNYWLPWIKSVELQRELQERKI
jgi:uncharacterized protein YbbC (DUF1343 family)